MGNDVRVIFDQATGNLYYDADGNDGANRVLFANVDVQSGSLDNTDFVVGP